MKSVRTSPLFTVVALLIMIIAVIAAAGLYVRATILVTAANEEHIRGGRGAA